MAKITCVFRRTAEGRLALLFAADLLKLLDSGAPLHIYLDQGADDAQRIAPDQAGVEQFLAAQNSSVLTEVAGLTGLSAQSIILTATEGDGGGILVDHITAFERADLDVLFPSREKTLLARGKGPLLVPFGDSDTALPSANIAIRLGKALALPVVFYHTTWKDQDVPSQSPADHMCDGAREVQERLDHIASAAGVEHSFVIETADDVAEGILHCAMRLSARLIVMPRSAKTTLGCYVNQALAKTPVPLLAVAAKPGRLV